jgi:hypothetical protein
VAKHVGRSVARFAEVRITAKRKNYISQKPFAIFSGSAGFLLSLFAIACICMIVLARFYICIELSQTHLCRKRINELILQGTIACKEQNASNQNR